jgi:hypothetical protein
MQVRRRLTATRTCRAGIEGQHLLPPSNIGEDGEELELVDVNHDTCYENCNSSVHII